MADEVFLSLESEHNLLLAERIVFIISSCLNIVALFCLIRKTPAHQLQIRTYLLVIQASVIATDVYLCICFEPFPVLQVFAGYCVGLLCRVLQPNTVAGIYGTLIGVMGASILLCIIRRHQAIVMRGRWVLTDKFFALLKWLLYVTFCGPILVFTAIPLDMEHAKHLVEQTVPNVTWIMDRGGYFMMERAAHHLIIIYILLLSLILVTAAAILVFIHMLIVLQAESDKSAKLKRAIRTSLVRFFVQIGIPILFIVVPIFALGMEIVFDCFSFDVCLIISCIVPFHPIVHNLILLLIVPEYRSYLAKLFDCRNANTVVASTTNPANAEARKATLVK